MAASISRSMVEVGISMVLRDQFSQNAGRITDSFRTMMRDMNTWEQALNGSFGRTFDFGTRMIGGMYDAFKYAATTQKEVFLTAKMAGASSKQQQELLQLAKDVNVQVPLTAQDIASGEKYLAMAGNSVENIKAMIPPAAKLASIFGMPLGGKGGVADLMTNIMSMYVIPAREASKVTDDLMVAVTSSNMSLTDLAQSIAYSGSEMANAGYDLRQTAAAIGVLGDMGIQGSSAGTALANMIRYLQLSIAGQKKKGINMMEALGLNPQEFLDAEGNLIDLGQVFKKFAKGLSNMNAVQRTQAFYNIFGVRGTRAMSNILRDMERGSNKFERIMDKYQNSLGIVNETNKEYLKTDQGRIDMFQSNFENLKTTFGMAMSKVFNPLLYGLSKLMGWINKIAETWTGSFLVRVVSTSVILGTIISGFKLLRNIFRSFAYVSSLASKNAAAMSGGINSSVVGATALEASLRRSVALMEMINGLALSAGQRMALGGGAYIGKTKKGVPYISYIGADGKRHRATGANNITGVMTGAAGAAAGGSAGAAAGAAGKKGFWGNIGRGAKSLGTKIKPAVKTVGWTMAISLAINLLTEAIGSLTDSTDENTDAVNNNSNSINDISAEEYYLLREKAVAEAIAKALKEGYMTKGMANLNITVDGRQLGTLREGETFDLDVLENLYNVQ